MWLAAKNKPFLQKTSTTSYVKKNYPFLHFCVRGCVVVMWRVIPWDNPTWKVRSPVKQGFFFFVALTLWEHTFFANKKESAFEINFKVSTFKWFIPFVWGGHPPDAKNCRSVHFINVSIFRINMKWDKFVWHWPVYCNWDVLMILLNGRSSLY